MVPHSIAFILYGVITTTSVPALFAAGIFPGILAGLSLIWPAYWILEHRGYMGEKRGSLKEVAAVFRDAFWGLLDPLVILGGINGGSSRLRKLPLLPCFIVVLLGLVVYRTLNLQSFCQILVDASISLVLPTVALGGLYSWAGATLGVMEKVAGSLLHVCLQPGVVLLHVNVLIFIAGML